MADNIKPVLPEEELTVSQPGKGQDLEEGGEHSFTNSQGDSGSDIGGDLSNIHQGGHVTNPVGSEATTFGADLEEETEELKEDNLVEESETENEKDSTESNTTIPTEDDTIMELSKKDPSSTSIENHDDSSNAASNNEDVSHVVPNRSESANNDNPVLDNVLASKNDDTIAPSPDESISDNLNSDSSDEKVIQNLEEDAVETTAENNLPADLDIEEDSDESKNESEGEDDEDSEGSSIDETTNVRPIANNVESSLSEDNNATTFNFSASDADSDEALTYVIDTQPASGSVVNNGDGTFTYNPSGAFENLSQGETAAVSFSYHVVDNEGASSEPASIQLTITGTNEAPTITSTSVESVNEGQNYAYDITTTDIDSI